MSLTIQGNIEFNNGLTLSSVYGRTKYSVNDDSSMVAISLEYWLDENAYTSNKLSLIDVPIYVDGGYAYNRTTDGEDVLVFTQNKIKEELENLGFSVVISEL
jgi:hypothetical protein